MKNRFLIVLFYIAMAIIFLAFMAAVVACHYYLIRMACK